MFTVNWGTSTYIIQTAQHNEGNFHVVALKTCVGLVERVDDKNLNYTN